MSNKLHVFARAYPEFKIGAQVVPQLRHKLCRNYNKDILYAWRRWLKKSMNGMIKKYLHEILIKFFAN